VARPPRLCALRHNPELERGRRPKKALTLELEHLPWAFENFSGYVAIDELYDGPFCVITIVDNRTFRRLFFTVLEKSPDGGDIKALLQRLEKELAERNLELLGVTTDASPLYPEPLRLVFPGVAHQICRFHAVHEINKAVLKAVSQMRSQLRQSLPKVRRGRPKGDAEKQLRRRKKHLETKITDLFDHRHLFVQKHLTPAERKTLLRITRGLPELRTLRAIVEQVYRLFDRRCKTDTALAKLAALRKKVERFKRLGKTLQKLQSPSLEKTLVFLDDKLLPSTSNAVERQNRRYRKMQKSVYRVRTLGGILGRIAADWHRERHQSGQNQTMLSLHTARAAG
jgi:hypothetical protein